MVLLFFRFFYSLMLSLEWPQVLGLDSRVMGGDFHPERQQRAEAGEVLSLQHVEWELAVGRVSVCPAAVAYVSLKEGEGPDLGTQSEELCSE